MNEILVIIAIGVWAIWYELRYGIDKRKETDKAFKRLSKKMENESHRKLEEFIKKRENSD